MFDLYQHLLPRSRAWDLIIDKPLRRLFRALGTTSTDAVTFINQALGDVLPEFTRRLDLWEQQFGLPDTGLTEQQRRDRLTATWRASGGQSPGYLQDTFRGAGFPVTVHEWWVPGSVPRDNLYLLGLTVAQLGQTGMQLGNSRATVTARNPNTVIRSDGVAIDYDYELGTTGAELGQTAVELGERGGTVGYLLVNKILDNDGNRVGYTVPTAPAQWPYVLYIGGETFGESVTIDPKRRDEFEELLLSISPGQQWLGVIVEYGA